ncbi:flavin-containing monooxygenase 12 [Mus musculus]|uniref:Flavin-containing monooxygenase n=1 Tax=Mus musculus TaxID=10090 RepID=G3X946_MOUSE|nr:flavin-containing monooxygenase 12 [Mus musculus]EDL39193.1 mCG12193 [Mus musculus]|eukprot:NP_001157784.1 flavin-containing monooxygenase 12 [Mus musculus]
MGVKRIAVIGAGVSGLGAIKCCLEEGLEPTCFEKKSDIGGLWKYEEIPKSGNLGIYKSLTCNTSKEMTAFSDYPIPDHYPNYMHHSKMMEYLRMYARHFGLMKHIQFQTNVCNIKKRPDFSSSGQWDVVVETEEMQKTYIFDGIMVCSGHYTEKYFPLQDFEGISKFQGSYLHTWEYKHPDNFVGKRVAVIGLGNSGADVAGEISRVADQVFLSTRQGAWIWNRVWDHGEPMDTTVFTRYNRAVQKICPRYIINRQMEKKLNGRFNHANYGLLPTHRILEQRTVLSDDLPNRIIIGKVKIKPNVKEFTSTSAIFEDGTKENIDVVIFATGYKLSFPFLSDDSGVLDNQYSMFKYVFPPELEKPTLAFIGILQPAGAILPTSELQSRWVVHVFKGIKKLPSRRAMIADINRKNHQIMAKGSKKILQDHRRVTFVDYMDEIASEIGVKPNLLSLLLWDTKLAKEVFCGPCTSYQYRLQGPGKWDGARAAILTQRERMLKPLRTRVVKQSHLSHLSWVKSACVVVFFFISVVVIMHITSH